MNIIYMECQSLLAFIPPNSPIHHTTTTSSPSVSVIFTDIEVQHSTAGGTPAGVLRTIVLRRVLELGIRKVTTKFRENFTIIEEGTTHLLFDESALHFHI